MIDEILAKDPTHKISLLLPVNVATSKVNLSVDIPPGYKKLKNSNSGLIEFIPKDDKDEYEWSEIITILPLIGQQISAKPYHKLIVEEFKKGAKDVKVLEDTYKLNDIDQYEEAFLTIAYNSGKRNEIVRMYTACGPYDCINTQYSLPAKDENKDTEKLMFFFNTYVKLINMKQ